ncbi:predicted protein [Botrytis cinerea T4]|uniref:Uncharacterized protein n=1 Tax=Botryotinia fuckeliana (strain T4) TaxID=999810 RepID=G2Y607_BOTF4|nr:predicted protein [Botrytis cinerea T4]
MHAMWESQKWSQTSDDRLSIADGEEILPTYGGHDARVRKLQAASFLPLFFSVRLEPTQITQKPTNPPKPHE